MRPIITLTTDFGTGSPYVAQMKGVILSICREVDLIDVTHAIGPQNIREGAVVLADATSRFPAGTIHVAVVDPGVGTSRRILYAEIGDQRYVAPDNGLISLLLQKQSRATADKHRSSADGATDQVTALRGVWLENSDYWLPQLSKTFHGRDILAPVAAHLASGVDPSELGPACEKPVLLEWPEPRISASRIDGHVLLVDSFGNLITNIRREHVAPLGQPASITTDCGGRLIRGIVPTYGAALAGEIVALFDSQERLEIAKVGGSAAEDLCIAAGEEVVVRC
jgi:S-adenosyl-L-methionine hydrolase (adenosine-forming)